MRSLVPSCVVCATALLLGVGSASAALGEETVPAPVYMGQAFLFQADLERGVELGWSPPSAPAEDLLDTVAEALEARLRRSGKFVEAVVLREEGDRFAVVFVGPQSRGFDEFLAQGLAGAGRIAYRVVASDPEAGGGSPSSKEEESAEGATGGDTTLLPWRPSAAGVAGFGEPVAVLAEPRHLLDPDSAEKLQLGMAHDGGWALAITLDEAGWDDLQSFVVEVGDGELALTVDGEVIGRGIDPSALERTLVVEGGFSLEEIRPVTFAFAGEPLPAPLEFLGTAERQLPNVKHRDSPTAIE